MERLLIASPPKNIKNNDLRWQVRTPADARVCGDV